jgi:hypothetical protein
VNLFERVAHTRQRIHDLRALKERAARASEFEQRAQTLRGIASGLGTISTPATVMHQAGIDVSQLDRVSLVGIQIKAEQLKDFYEKDRNSILNPFPDQDFRQVFLAPCSALKQKTETALKEAWSIWVRGKRPAIDQEVLNVLAGVNALSRTVVSIQELLSQIARHASALPTNAEDVKEVIDSCAQADQAWHALAGDGIAPEILTFLRAAGSGIGAQYDLLTPSVLEWLDAHKLRHLLRIRLG